MQVFFRGNMHLVTQITTSNTTTRNNPNTPCNPCRIADFGVYFRNIYAHVTNRTCFVTRFFIIWKYRKATQFLAYSASQGAVTQIIPKENDHGQHRSGSQSPAIGLADNPSSHCITCGIFHHIATEIDRGIQTGNSDRHRLFAIE